MGYLIFILEEAFERKDHEDYWSLSKAKIVLVQATMANGVTESRLQSFFTLTTDGGECQLHVSATLFLWEAPPPGLVLNRTLGGLHSQFGTL
jgi:hypothetical protein